MFRLSKLGDSKRVLSDAEAAVKAMETAVSSANTGPVPLVRGLFQPFVQEWSGMARSCDSFVKTKTRRRNGKRSSSHGTRSKHAITPEVLVLTAFSGQCSFQLQVEVTAFVLLNKLERLSCLGEQGN